MTCSHHDSCSTKATDIFWWVPGAFLWLLRLSGLLDKDKMLLFVFTLALLPDNKDVVVWSQRSRDESCQMYFSWRASLHRLSEPHPSAVAQNVITLLYEMCFITNRGKIIVTFSLVNKSVCLWVCVCAHTNWALSIHNGKWKQNTSNVQSFPCHHSFSFWTLGRTHMLNTNAIYPPSCILICSTLFWGPDSWGSNLRVQTEATQNQLVLQLHSDQSISVHWDKMGTRCWTVRLTGLNPDVLPIHGVLPNLMGQWI